MNLTGESFLLEDDCDLNQLNFLGVIACSVRNIFKEELEKALAFHKDKKHVILNAYVPSGCACHLDLSSIWDAKDIEDFPDIVAANGFVNEFKKQFMNTLASRDNFKAVRKSNINKEFLEAGCVDPEGIYTMYAVMPEVMLIDKNKLKGLPVPKRWGDLLNPIYKDNIILGGNSEELSDAVTFYIYKQYGEEGVKKLLNNTKNLWHRSKMSKTGGTMNGDGAAIYTMSWFFAKSCPNTDKTEIVWPEDGAVINPMCMLARASKASKMDNLIDFVTGETLGKRLADSYFPSLNANVDNNLPHGAGFKWLGWDYIRENNLEKIKDIVYGIFEKELKNKIKN